MTTLPDPFEQDDASYVLGLLIEEERAAFETHLATCPDCTERVRRLAGLPAALDGLTSRDVEELAATPPVPDTLLPMLLRTATAAARRRRRIVGTLAGVAATSVVALVLVVSLVARAPHAGVDAGAATMTAVTATPLTATAALQDVPWGTRISLDCRYAASSTWSSEATYRLQVVDRSGVVHDLGTWTAHSGAEVTFTSGTALARTDLASVRITLLDGTPILQLAA